VPGQFARLAARLEYPVYVVTTAAGEERSGCLVGFATQCSIRPPRFLACISKKNHTSLVASRADVLAVHVVGAEHRPIAQLFGGETGDEVDKFGRTAWRSVDGVPVLDACDAWFTGSIQQRIDLGDHTGYLLAPIEAATDVGEEQLMFQQARDIEPGHDP
jgi:flavin reductase (DIM6/NTAB) family NADH-FMN oxidoreductase RutF